MFQTSRQKDLDPWSYMKSRLFSLENQNLNFGSFIFLSFWCTVFACELTWCELVFKNERKTKTNDSDFEILKVGSEF